MQQIIQGSPRELASYLAQEPDGKFQLIRLDEDASEPSAPVLDEKAKAGIALLDSWIAEGKAASEETRREARQEVEEFKRNMNANREATGERIVYP